MNTNTKTESGFVTIEHPIINGVWCHDQSMAGNDIYITEASTLQSNPTDPWGRLIGDRIPSCDDEGEVVKWVATAVIGSFRVKLIIFND